MIAGATIKTRDAIGRVRYSGDMRGQAAFVVDVLGSLLADPPVALEPGDTLELSVHVEIPDGHPLDGVLLAAD